MAKKKKVHSNAIAILSIIFGIIVIVEPEVLSWVVGIYLIIIGVMHLVPN